MQLTSSFSLRDKKKNMSPVSSKQTIRIHPTPRHRGGGWLPATQQGEQPQQSVLRKPTAANTVIAAVAAE